MKNILSTSWLVVLFVIASFDVQKQKENWAKKYNWHVVSMRSDWKTVFVANE